MRVLIGLFILFIGYRSLALEFNIRRSTKTFLQTEHPEHTVRIDSLVLEVNYYPATYIDDSIQFQSAFLVGEIRSYDGDWEFLKTSYAGKRFVVPLKIGRNEQRIWLAFPDDFSFDPFQAEILKALQDHYPSDRLTQRFDEAERAFDFVYMFADP